MDLVDPRDYGATADGPEGFDNYPAFQAAIDAAIASNKGLLIPPGPERYRINGCLDVSSTEHFPMIGVSQYHSRLYFKNFGGRCIDARGSKVLMQDFAIQGAAGSAIPLIGIDASTPGCRSSFSKFARLNITGSFQRYGLLYGYANEEPMTCGYTPIENDPTNGGSDYTSFDQVRAYVTTDGDGSEGGAEECAAVKLMYCFGGNMRLCHFGLKSVTGGTQPQREGWSLILQKVNDYTIQDSYINGSSENKLLIKTDSSGLNVYQQRLQNIVFEHAGYHGNSLNQHVLIDAPVWWGNVLENISMSSQTIGIFPPIRTTLGTRIENTLFANINNVVGGVDRIMEFGEIDNCEFKRIRDTGGAIEHVKYGVASSGNEFGPGVTETT